MLRKTHLANAIVAVASLVMVAGCATTKKEPSESTEMLYDGKAKTLYDAKQIAETGDEAMQLGNNALRMGDVDQALYQFVKAYELDREKYEALYKVGVIHAQRDSLERAAMAFSLVLKQQPAHNQALLEMGLIELRKRRYAKAEEHLTKAIETNPQLWRAHNGLGVLADLNKDFESAQQHYAEALKLSPESPVLLNNLGYSKYLAGDWEGAQQSIQEALNMDPQYEQAWLNLGLIHVRQESYQHALVVFEKVMDKAQAYERIGSLCMIEGKYADAEKFLNLAIDSSPSYYKAAYDKLERLKSIAADSTKSTLDASDLAAEPQLENPLYEADHSVKPTRLSVDPDIKK